MIESKTRFFISHSSKDKVTIDKFIDLILKLGLQIHTEQIAYTSREETGVPPGVSIPNYIENNIASADYILIIISDNYKSSEVCLNELGAAWALKKDLIQIILPNTSFSKLGWLTSLNKALKIDDEESLDSLYDKLNCKSKVSTWNKHKQEFLTYCNKLNNIQLQTIQQPLSPTPIIKEEGLLDLRIQLEDCIKKSMIYLSNITKGMLDNSYKISQKAKQVTLNRNNINLLRKVIIATAKTMDQLSTIKEQNTPLLEKSMLQALTLGIKIKQLIKSQNQEDIKNEFTAINTMIYEINKTKQEIINLRRAIDQVPKIEKTFNSSQSRLIKNCTTLINVLDSFISKAFELAIATLT